jgi:MerR family transcriptional regulator, copper efflux regulator
VGAGGPKPLRAGALARMAGVSTDTLRVYEKRGLLPRPGRAANGYREYTVEALTRVRVVRQALALGFTLGELARVFRVRDQGGAPCRDVRALAGAKMERLDETLAELGRARERLRAVLRRWDEILAATPQGARAALLHALEGLVEAGEPSPFVPASLRRRRRPR